MSAPTSSPRISTDERAARVRYRRAVSLLLMTLVLPGSAQLVAGNKRVGRGVLRGLAIALVVTMLVGAYGVINHGFFIRLGFNTGFLQLVRLFLIALAIGWAALFVDAWRIGRPPSLLTQHRRVTLGINAALCLAVASVLFYSSHVVNAQRGLAAAMFSGTKVTGAHAGRYNVLLLGGDSGAGRWGLRPDSMTVASIDAGTGKTVLVGLPRNMSNFRFKPGSVMAQQFPNGWGGTGKYLNGLSTWAEDHKDLFPDSENPGVDATIEGIEGITGLQINYWAMVNLHGFHKLVDAVGGVTLNVRQPIPVGGLGKDVTGYVQPGIRKLDGHEVLWFARARDSSDDYSRMARQKCVMGAMLSQLSPAKVLTHFTKIADASSSMISTSIPASEVDTFVSLALKAKSQKIATVSLVPPAIITAHPNQKKAQRMIAQAISGKKATGTTKVSPSAGTSATAGSSGSTGSTGGSDTLVTGGSIGSLKTGYAANQSDDLAASC
ncbi:LCP family protein [Nocardioides sp.]|uniref:LCP family protein n=1 Tax=Nocardioides sp. TaxID=35761 RepID=UPI00262EB7F8|nr:LCP family protein [Nocardioides sp.]